MWLILVASDYFELIAMTSWSLRGKAKLQETDALCHSLGKASVDVRCSRTSAISTRRISSPKERFSNPESLRRMEISHACKWNS